MHLLPQNLDDASYWSDVYKQPISFWQQALHCITEEQHLPAESWTRAALGRNIVFLTPTLVIKLGPPMWLGEMAREVAALQFVVGQLPVATPVLIAAGTLDGWDYLIQERLPGTDLWGSWPHLASDTRASIARQHGEVMAALHTLPLQDASPDLHFDWAGMLAAQHESCARDMRAGGVDDALVEQVESYLAATPWSIEHGEIALVQGDLASLNLMVSEVNGALKITGLIDWGDAKIGAPSHEFISPGVHMYRGDRNALRHWYEGYHLLKSERSVEYQHVIMARAMLYYQDDFAKRIEWTPGASSCADWVAMASAFWHML